MTFLEKSQEYDLFRKRLIPILMTALPSDQAACYDQRSILEPLYWEAGEIAADLESLYMAKKTTEADLLLTGGFPKSAALEFAKTKAFEERRYMLNAQHAVSSIHDRQIRLSQNLKLRES